MYVAGFLLIASSGKVTTIPCPSFSPLSIDDSTGDESTAMTQADGSSAGQRPVTSRRGGVQQRRADRHETRERPRQLIDTEVRRFKARPVATAWRSYGSDASGGSNTQAGVARGLLWQGPRRLLLEEVRPAAQRQNPAGAATRGEAAFRKGKNGGGRARHRTAQ